MQLKPVQVLFKIKGYNQRQGKVIKINTNHLIYDDINKIAKNDKPFESVYNSHFYKGINLYLDLNVFMNQ